MKSSKRGKAAILTTMLSAENYAIKTMLAGKILECHLLYLLKGGLLFKNVLIFSHSMVRVVATLVHNKKSVICSANRDYIEVFHLTKSND